ncbi:hypothetical protein FS837_012132, partial [Tulasnella sp. UAMH 9824]
MTQYASMDGIAVLFTSFNNARQRSLWNSPSTGGNLLRPILERPLSLKTLIPSSPPHPTQPLRTLDSDAQPSPAPSYDPDLCGTSTLYDF